MDAAALSVFLAGLVPDNEENDADVRQLHGIEAGTDAGYLADCIKTSLETTLGGLETALCDRLESVGAAITELASDEPRYRNLAA